jgi:hypothetical protein
MHAQHVRRREASDSEGEESLRVLLIILHLLNFVPIQSRPPALAPGPRPAGFGTLLITSCRPLSGFWIEPAHLHAVADSEGSVIMKAPAQRDQDEPYAFLNTTFNGTLHANESLSASCP